MDNFNNFAVAELTTAPNGSATSITVESGQGSRFPTPNFYLVIWDYDSWVDSSLAYHNNKAEIIKVTNIATDTLTIERAQQGTSAINFTGSSDVRIGQTWLTHNIEEIVVKDGSVAMTSGLTINDYTLPSSDGNNGDLLTTDGAGNLTWEAPEDVLPWVTKDV